MPWEKRGKEECAKKRRWKEGVWRRGEMREDEGDKLDVKYLVNNVWNGRRQEDEFHQSILIRKTRSFCISAVYTIAS